MSWSEETEAVETDEGGFPVTKVLEDLGLVAGMFNEFEIGDCIDEHNAQVFDERARVLRHCLIKRAYQRLTQSGSPIPRFCHAPASL